MLTPEQKKGLNGVCEVVAIATPAGPVNINAHDFDPKVHKKFEGAVEQPKVDGSEQQPGKPRSQMTKAELVAALTELNIPADARMTKDELLNLFPAE